MHRQCGVFVAQWTTPRSNTLTGIAARDQIEPLFRFGAPSTEHTLTDSE
jgi:hypothetical protein